MNTVTHEKAEFLKHWQALRREDQAALFTFMQALAAHDPTAEWVADLVNAGQVGGQLALEIVKEQTEH